VTTLRARLTFSYAALVAVVLIALAVVLTRLAFGLLAQPTLDLVSRRVAEAQLIAAAHPEMNGRALGLLIRRTVSGRGVVVLLLPPQMDGRPRDTPPGPPPDDVTNIVRPFTTSSLLGMRDRPFFLPDGTMIRIVPDLRRLGPAVRLYLASLAISVLAALLLAWVVGRWITAQAIAPLITVTAELRRFANGDFTPRRVTTNDRSELGQLTAAFNGAATQVAAAFEERVRLEEQMRRFLADAGHELRTPLTVVSGFLDVLERDGASGPGIRERAFRTLRVETHRMRRLVERLMALARLERPDSAEPETVDVTAIVQDAVTEVSTARRGNVGLHIAAGENLVMGDPGELHEAVGNLVDNALKYGGGTPVSVEVAREDEQVFVRVNDRGPGIPAAERAHVFERFFRGESTGGVEGSGLGLAIARRAAARCGGTVHLACDEAVGTTFTLRFPAKPRSEARTALRLG
jgi:two-component system OmpR family sensor kinase